MTDPFDADAEAAALEPFRVQIDGRLYEGKPLSYPAYRRFELAMLTYATAKDPVAAFEDAVRDALRASFPTRKLYLVRPSRDPVIRILSLTPVVREKALAHFFSLLARWRGAAPEEPVSTPTPPRPSDSASLCSAAPN